MEPSEYIYIYILKVQNLRATRQNHILIPVFIPSRHVADGPVRHTEEMYPFMLNLEANIELFIFSRECSKYSYANSSISSGCQYSSTPLTIHVGSAAANTFAIHPLLVLALAHASRALRRCFSLYKRVVAATAKGEGAELAPGGFNDGWMDGSSMQMGFNPEYFPMG